MARGEPLRDPEGVRGANPTAVTTVTGIGKLPVSVIREGGARVRGKGEPPRDPDEERGATSGPDPSDQSHRGG